MVVITAEIFMSFIIFHYAAIDIVLKSRVGLLINFGIRYLRELSVNI